MPTIQLPEIQFVDIAQRETFARQQLRIDIEKLEARQKKHGLSAIDQVELKRLKALEAAANNNNKHRYVDPLFAAARAQFADKDNGLQPIKIDHDNGELSVGSATSSAQVARLALVLGLLQLHDAPLPQLKVVRGDIAPDEKHENTPRFAEAFYPAVGRAARNMPLAQQVLMFIAEAVGENGGAGASQVSSREYAKVFEKLTEKGVTATDPNLKLRVEEELDRAQDLGDEKPQHEISINLPDLEATTDQRVQKDNIQLMGPMIFASMFDELKAFQVVDKLVDMSQRGELPLIRGKAGTLLYNYWRQAPNRMSELERQNFYSMTLGIPTGQPGVPVNSDFQDLWIRFVSSVSSLVRENRVDQMLRSNLPIAINQQQVKKAARDLAANMSLHGYGMAFYAAVDLQAQINEMIELLKDEELRGAFGARDMWGVIDQIAQVELGGARNSSKYRTLATCGAIITTWLATNTNRLRDTTMPMIDLSAVENPPGRPSGQTATSHPTDYDLVNACELWLADSAMADERVDELSQPRESPQQPSRPIQMPSIARDLLNSAGLGMEMGLGNGNGNGRRPNGRSRSGYAGY